MFGHLENFSAAQIQTFYKGTYCPMCSWPEAVAHLKRIRTGDLVFMGSEAALAGTRKGSLYCGEIWFARACSVPEV